MILKKKISSGTINIFMGIVLVIFLNKASYADNNPQRIGFSNSYPTTFSDWGNAYLSGNGKMGIMVFGNPLNETVIYNDRKFFLAASNERSFNQVSPSDLEQIRNYCAEENWGAANTLANKVHGWKNGGEGNKHPGFGMLINIPQDGAISNYSRTCNFRTGEIIVKWTDNRGNWERKSFVSRKDNVVVQYLTAPKNGTISCSVQLTTDPGMNFPKDMAFTSLATTGNLNLRANYPKNTNGAGYEGVVRVVTSGGTKSVDGNVLKISNAKSVILLTRTEKYYSNCETQWDQQKIQGQLAAISTDYNILLKGQLATHQAIYDRVKLNLNAGAADRALSNEDLLARQKSSSIAVNALWERIFDAGRYYYLSSSSDQAPPDLLGIWTGDCNVGWNGFYHLDANLNLQVSGGNIGDMPEAMEGYFTLMERLKEGFQTNATKLLGCRGMLGGGNTAGLNGLISSLNFYYPYQYVTGEMGWLLYPFWEHYLITGDENFLRDRLYPLLKEMGYFYEDFLVKTDSNGKYIFAGSISPENQPGGLKFSLVNNSTFDIAGAKFCLSTLIQTCNILGLEQGSGGGVEKWKAILDKLPPYLVNSEGALQEWSWPGLKENYGHRHSSHLITVWPLREITPESTPDLYKAARITLNKKDEHKYENAGHGLLHSALNATGLKNEKSVNDKLLRLTKEDFYYNSLCTSHYDRHGIFCTDVANTVPAIMMEMLVSTSPGILELLPALPESLKKGEISGMKGRNRITIERLSWDLAAKVVNCTLRSDIDQQITLIERNGIKAIKTKTLTNGSKLGQIAREVQLKAGERTEITMGL
jgi:alpha-L-fucosidase 2